MGKKLNTELIYNHKQCPIITIQYAEVLVIVIWSQSKIDYCYDFNQTNSIFFCSLIMNYDQSTADVKQGLEEGQRLVHHL